jgi:hypothetical protein
MTSTRSWTAGSSAPNNGGLAELVRPGRVLAIQLNRQHKQLLKVRTVRSGVAGRMMIAGQRYRRAALEENVRLGYARDPVAVGRRQVRRALGRGQR